MAQAGWLICHTGQENWLPKQIHAEIRFWHTDIMARDIRYQPDLLIYHRTHSLWWYECKAISDTYLNGANFSIETACLDTCRDLQARGHRVLIVFENEPGDFHGVMPLQLKVYKQFGHEDTASMNGSGTPMTLTRKVHTQPLGDDGLVVGQWGLL